MIRLERFFSIFSFHNKSFKMDRLVEQVGELCLDLSDDLRTNKDQRHTQQRLNKHLKEVITLNKEEQKLPDFKPGLEWMNVTEPLSLQYHLQGKIIILDFFTYCCINCMHILPDLKRLEQEITVEDGLVVIGVHSPKFLNETKTVNIESAVRRYDITHPVVNDNQESMWRALSVHCWPTLYVLGPNSEPLLMLQGEGHFNTLKFFVSEAISHYKKKGMISERTIPQIKAFSFPVVSNILYYPGKVAVKVDGSLLAISDTAHNRIIVAKPDGEIMEEIGDSSPGLADGNFENSKFFSPQGLTFYEDKIFVADTENHCIREINLTTRKVVTVVGVGSQGHDYVGGKKGTLQPISSPWDCCIANDILFIAMAGTHQLWAYFLKDTTLWKKKYQGERCAAVVGSGREENRNNQYPMSAGLAQPSGLALDGHSLYLADSESSSVRCVSLQTGAVTPLAGGALDPRNLFAFGDKDGIGLDAKLQHPLGVTWCSFDDSVYVADSYNHKVKRIDKISRKCDTVVCTDGKLSEPGGLCAAKELLYIADTNNHAVKILDVKNLEITEIHFKHKEVRLLSTKRADRTDTVQVQASGGQLVLTVNLSLPENCSLTKGVSSKWFLHLPGGRIKTEDENFTLKRSWNLDIVRARSPHQTIVIKSRLFLCVDDTCTVKELLFEIKLLFQDDAPRIASCTINYDV